jgi:hypothetical protein
MSLPEKLREALQVEDEKEDEDERHSTQVVDFPAGEACTHYKTGRSTESAGHNGIALRREFMYGARIWICDEEVRNHQT